MVRSEGAARTVSSQLRFQILSLADGMGEVTSHEEAAWSSVTFAGTRHELEICFYGNHACEAGERMIAELPEHEFRISGQIVVDASHRNLDHHFAGGAEEMKVTLVCLLMKED
ncbi:MAG: hypothetical protein AAF650_04820 [Pseudomonadota bacterium]